MNRAVIALLVLSVLLGGCISIGGGGDDNAGASTFTLKARDGAAASGARTGPTLVIAKPEVPPDLAGERIALAFNQGAQQDFYAKARWSARLDDLLQEFFTQSARRDLSGVIVTPPNTTAARYRLDIKVTEFRPVYPGSPDTIPELKASVTATLVSLPDGTPRAQLTANKAASASANTLTAVTQGLESLLQAVAEEVFRKVGGELGGREPKSGG